jgi:hypothetical protein
MVLVISNQNWNGKPQLRAELCSVELRGSGSGVSEICSFFDSLIVERLRQAHLQPHAFEIPAPNVLGSLTTIMGRMREISSRKKSTPVR